VFFDCVRNGVIPLYDYEMNVLRIQPPLTIEERLLEKALDVMEDALRNTPASSGSAPDGSGPGR